MSKKEISIQKEGLCVMKDVVEGEVMNLEKVIEKTSYKQLGVGGIDTRGVARNLYPR